MAEIGRWSGLKFEVKSGLVRGFSGLTIKGSVETEDKNTNAIKYVANKARKPTEVSLTVHLDARTGHSDVRGTATGLISKSTYGAEDYFYIGNKKLVPYKLKLTEATVNEVRLTNNGTWICCDVKMTMKQSSLPDSSGGSGGGGGGGSPQKVSVKKTTTTTTPTNSLASKIVGAVKGAVTGAINTVKKAVTTVKNVLTGKTTVASAVSSAVKAGVSAVQKVATAAKKVTAAAKPAATTTAKAKITSVVNKVKSIFKKK